MVMSKNVMAKNLFQTIRRSLGRYIAIVAIIALGCAIFVGLRVTKTDMVATGQKYTDEQNMFDLRLVNSYGWSQEDVEKFAAMEGVVDAEGTVMLDAFVRQGRSREDEIFRLYAIPEDVNKVHLLGGRMPRNSRECLVDGYNVTDDIIGTTIKISESNDGDTLDSLNEHTFRVVGYVSTPLYMDMTRGNTTLGNGQLSSYVYLPREAFAVDYYADICLTIAGDYEIYTQAFADAMDSFAKDIEEAVKLAANDRYLQLRADALIAYQDGLLEYEQGLADYEKAKQEVMDSLAEGFAQLQTAQQEIEDNEKLLLDGKTQLEEAKALLSEKQAEFEAGLREYEDKKKETYAQLEAGQKELDDGYATVGQNLSLVADGLRQIEDGLGQIEDGLSQIEEGLPLLELAITLGQSNVAITQAALNAALASPLTPQALIRELEQRLQTQTAELNGYIAQRDEAVSTREMLNAKKQELLATQQELNQNKQQLEAAMAELDAGAAELKAGKETADKEFAAAKLQLDDALQQLTQAQEELAAKEAELISGLEALEEGKAELQKGWEEYESGKVTAETELADALIKLEAGKQELDDAQKLIADMSEPDVLVLTRNTNAGYLALDSNSDIVHGVSKVFPVFFLLVAALVCITTMTRMVDEERTQIGTLKALGYSNFAIMSKYLVYTGSAAIIGCVVGTLAGCVVFPWILWGAYSIIFNITPGVTLLVDWPLCIAVVTAYTAVSLFVTWYSCRRTLKEEPAQLIRPKPPTSGKKILLEYLPFWNKLSFLNKVTLRNVVRYRQRLMMMLVGIGGCTALLVTGFGMRDSIVDIAHIQFEEVSVYDLQVYFREDQSSQQQEDFRNAVGQDAGDIAFFRQLSAELDFGGRVRDISLIISGADIQNHMDLHTGETKLSLPGENEALISVGAAEAMGIQVGDTISVRDADLQTLTLTISGIFDNHVQNYFLVSPDTVQSQWGEPVGYQMAFVNAASDDGIHSLSGKITGLDGVLNVTVNADQADLVDSMMDALIMVVVTVVACAGMLAVTVLYNLTNINITERIREIATIKVLGFNAKETASYVFKENILLSVMGAALGMLGGRLLLEFVMDQVKIDMVWFQARISWIGYVASVALTLLSAWVVNYIFRFKLDKINMAEALKSVE